jgi:His/Glu/Gln/Arg/opine family amino acid ABC transporter permease subunit
VEAVLPFVPYLAVGLAVTLAVSVAAFALAGVLGFAVAMGQVRGGRVMRRALGVYLTVFRSLPELLVIFFVFYGLDLVLKYAAGALGRAAPSADPFLAATLAIGVQFGAYCAGIFRDAHAALHPGLAEAGAAIGMTPGQITRRILAPLMLRTALPSLGNMFLVVLKVSALASVVGLEEIARRAKIVAGSTREPLATFFVASLAFLAVTAVVMILLARIERAQPGRAA